MGQINSSQHESETKNLGKKLNKTSDSSESNKYYI